MPTKKRGSAKINKKQKLFFCTLFIHHLTQIFPANKKQNKMIEMKEVLVSEDDYRAALKRFLEICDAEENSPEAEELEQLMTIMEIYEQENCS
jgi:hypothetical protein